MMPFCPYNAFASRADIECGRKPVLDANPKAQSPAQRSGEAQMKECFGVSMGWFMEDMVGDYDQRLLCYQCTDFDACFKLASLRASVQLRFEIRRSSQQLGLAFGGRYTARPFG